MTAFTGVDSQNLLDVMVSVQFILAIGENLISFAKLNLTIDLTRKEYQKNLPILI
ncbi:hypothetical protein [Lactobacillus delbrueckii]|uniref:hypothetical protein n=1 Tax=Lactobacillus delbrueckii TaxID=1584 RepID=UPI0035D102C6